MLSWLLVSLALTNPTPELTPRQLQILNTLNESGPRIDGCVARYLTEQPGRKGAAEIAVTPDPEGRVRAVDVTTALPQARSLRACLERVARTWALPPPQKDSARLSLTVPVAPGAKFRIPKPGEEPPKPDKDEDAPPPTWFNPASSGFLPKGW